MICTTLVIWSVQYFAIAQNNNSDPNQASQTKQTTKNDDEAQADKQDGKSTSNSVEPSGKKATNVDYDKRLKEIEAEVSVLMKELLLATTSNELDRSAAISKKMDVLSKEMNEIRKLTEGAKQTKGSNNNTTTSKKRNLKTIPESQKTSKKAPRSPVKKILPRGSQSTSVPVTQNTKPGNKAAIEAERLNLASAKNLNTTVPQSNNRASDPNGEVVQKVKPPVVTGKKDKEEQVKEVETPPQKPIKFNGDEVVKLDMTNHELDVDMLIEKVGKEMNFNFIYPDNQPVTGKVRLQKYGTIRHRDLLPLLESVLSFKNYTMVREDPFIRIVKRDEAMRKAEPLLSVGQELPDREIGDSVVTQIVEIQHVTVDQARGFLRNFADEKTLLIVPNTKYIIITEYAYRMDRIMEMLKLIDQPGPSVSMEIIHVEYLTAQDAAKQVSELMKNLNQSGAKPAGGQRQPARAARQPRAQPANNQQPRNNAAAASGTVQTGNNGPMLYVDVRTSRIFAIGDEEGLIQVKELLSLIDVPSGPEIKLYPIEIKHVLADEVAAQIVGLMQDLNKDESAKSANNTSRNATAQRRGGHANRNRANTNQPNLNNSRSRTSRSGSGSQVFKVSDMGPYIHIDIRTNRMLILGSQDQLDQIIELLQLLDVPPREYEMLTLNVYTPQFVEAEECRKILNDLGIIQTRQSTARSRANRRSNNTGGAQGSTADANRSSLIPTDPELLPGEQEAEIRVAVQQATNTMFVLATQRQHVVISEIMTKVDNEVNKLGDIRIYALENRDPKFVADMLKELMESSQLQVTQNNATRIPGVEGAPIIVPLADIYSVAVRGSKKQHADIEKIITNLDRRLPSVLVEAILVTVNIDDKIDLGVSLKNKGTVTNDPTNPRLVSGTSPFNIGTIAKSTSNIISGSGATLAFFDDDFIYATLEALEEEGNSRVISRPRILVNDNQTGVIDSKREEPTTTQTFQQGSENAVVTFSGYEEAGTKLDIIPHIGSNESDMLQLEIKLDVASFVGSRIGDIPPPRETNSVSTWVTVPDGKTIVLGGLVTETDSTKVRKVPLLGDIPILGAAFRSIGRTKDKGVLYVFIKAHVVGRDGVDDKVPLDDLSDEAKQEVNKFDLQNSQHSIIPGLPDNKSKRTKLFKDGNN